MRHMIFRFFRWKMDENGYCFTTFMISVYSFRLPLHHFGSVMMQWRANWIKLVNYTHLSCQLSIYEYGINGVDFMLSPLLKSSQPFFAFVCFDRYCKNAFHQLLKIPQRTPEDPTFKRLVFGSIPFSTPALHCLLLHEK